MNCQKIVLFLGFALPVFVWGNATIIPSSALISRDTTWSDSIILQGDISISASLTIEKGSTILTNNNTYTITITGNLVALGTREDSIKLKKVTLLHLAGSRGNYAFCSFQEGVAKLEAGRATIQGGAMNLRGGNVAVAHSLFANNRAEDAVSENAQGGALFIGNAVISLDTCWFASNRANNGGAVAIDTATAAPLFNQVQFYNNSSNGSGGGAFYISAVRRLSLVHCDIRNNRSEGRENGGAISILSGDLAMWGCIVANNESTSLGGGIYTETDGTIDFVHSLLVSNKANSGEGFYARNTVLNFTNSVVWNNVSSGDFITPPRVAVISSLAGDIVYQGAPHLGDSLFLSPSPTKGNAPDALAADWRHASVSVAIDSAAAIALPAGVTTDLDSLPRSIGGRSDLGPYEFSSTFTLTIRDKESNALLPSVFIIEGVVYSYPSSVRVPYLGRDSMLKAIILHTTIDNKVVRDSVETVVDAYRIDSVKYLTVPACERLLTLFVKAGDVDTFLNKATVRIGERTMETGTSGRVQFVLPCTPSPMSDLEYYVRAEKYRDSSGVITFRSFDQQDTLWLSLYPVPVPEPEPEPEPEPPVKSSVVRFWVIDGLDTPIPQATIRMPDSSVQTNRRGVAYLNRVASSPIPYSYECTAPPEHLDTSGVFSLAGTPDTFHVIVRMVRKRRLALYFEYLYSKDPIPGVKVSLSNTPPVQFSDGNGRVSFYPVFLRRSYQLAWNKPDGEKKTTFLFPTRLSDFSDTLRFELPLLSEEIYDHQQISPNGDGLNDYLQLYREGLSGEVSIHVKVYDDRGTLVYEKKNYQDSDRWQIPKAGKYVLQLYIPDYKKIITKYLHVID